MGPANITSAEAKLNVLIRQLQHDPNAYSGHRDRAVEFLTQAQQELIAAAAAAQ